MSQADAIRERLAKGQCDAQIAEDLKVQRAYVRVVRARTSSDGFPKDRHCDRTWRNTPERLAQMREYAAAWKLRKNSEAA